MTTPTEQIIELVDPLLRDVTHLSSVPSSEVVDLLLDIRNLASRAVAPPGGGAMLDYMTNTRAETLFADIRFFISQHKVTALALATSVIANMTVFVLRVLS